MQTKNILESTLKANSRTITISNNLLGIRRNHKEKLYHWNRTMNDDTPFGETTNFTIVGVRLKMLPE